ncbi:hypothetical protein BDM02DRAFT_3194263 [Thelephora ganbajun]|uniref:Uncharacterized protein n=1 Tax=Thelephora ganbajun TaxID=370292 RepID=A0ACB6YWU1_THEGA|nr:hypothetical protein BDM02DRAFT_3194263 [Thelephora ganbajun]
MASRKYLESVVAKGRPERVKSYEVSFVGMVLPREELHIKIKCIGARQGNMVVKVETYNDRDVKVPEGTVKVAQPPTAYVFTDQGPVDSTTRRHVFVALYSAHTKLGLILFYFIVSSPLQSKNGQKRKIAIPDSDSNPDSSDLEGYETDPTTRPLPKKKQRRYSTGTSLPPL